MNYEHNVCVVPFISADEVYSSSHVVLYLTDILPYTGRMRGKTLQCQSIL